MCLKQNPSTTNNSTTLIMSNHSIIRITRACILNDLSGAGTRLTDHWCRNWVICRDSKIHVSLHSLLRSLDLLLICPALAVACRDVDVRNVKALIVGPPDTPYEFGFFEVWPAPRDNQAMADLLSSSMSDLAKNTQPRRHLSSRRLRTADDADSIQTYMRKERSACEFMRSIDHWETSLTRAVDRS